MNVTEFCRQLRNNPTPSEVWLWQYLKNKQINGRKFNRQFPIMHSDDNGKKSYFIADFYCHTLKLIIELDGGIHKLQIEYDQMRDDILTNLGYQVHRFPNSIIQTNPMGLLEAIKCLCE